MNCQPLAPSRMPRPRGILLLASLLLGLLAAPPAVSARDGDILAGKQRLPLAYRFKKGVRYLPVAATLSALGVTHRELPKEATLTVQSPWNGTVQLLFRPAEAQVAGKIVRLQPAPIQRDGAWFLSVGQMADLLGISAELNASNDLVLAAMTRLEHTPAGLQLRTGAPVNPRGFYLDNPPRYVIDLPGARLDRKHPDPYPTHEPGYRAVRLGQFEPTTARIVYDLTDPRWRSPLASKTGLTLLTLGEAETPQVVPSTQIRLGIAQDGTGLVLNGLHARTATLRTESPSRLVVTFTGAGLAATATPYQHRPELTATGIQRVALDPAAGDTVILTVDLQRSAPEASLQFDPATSRTLLFLRAPQSATPTHPGLKSLRGRTVVIDAGHGGRWPGAAMEPGMVGPTRLLEKDLNLRMSLDLKQRLEALGIRAILTRSDDTVLHDDLREDLLLRLKMATDHQADLLVSVHCNSFRTIPSDALSGTEVYFNKASDKAIANTLFEHIAAKTGRGGRGALYGQLLLTKHQSIPSVLVECAYMSNPDEYALLCDPTHAYEKTLMAGLTDGIVAVLSGDTTLPRESLPMPLLDAPDWLNKLAEHQLLDSSGRSAPLASGQTDLFSLAPDTQRSASPFEVPATEGLPSIPPPQYLPLPNRAGRPAVDPRASQLPDPEIDFGEVTEIESTLVPRTEESDTTDAESVTPVPGATPQERRYSIFSLG